MDEIGRYGLLLSADNPFTMAITNHETKGETMTERVVYEVDRPGGKRAQVGDDQSMRYLWKLALDGYSVPVRWYIVRD